MGLGLGLGLVRVRVRVRVRVGPSPSPSPNLPEHEDISGVEQVKDHGVRVLLVRG